MLFLVLSLRINGLVTTTTKPKRSYVLTYFQSVCVERTSKKLTPNSLASQCVKQKLAFFSESKSPPSHKLNRKSNTCCSEVSPSWQIRCLLLLDLAIWTYTEASAGDGSSPSIWEGPHLLPSSHQALTWSRYLTF